MRTRPIWSLLAMLLAALVVAAGCTLTPVPTAEPVAGAASEPTAAPATNAKYVFLFIGDGMGIAQRNAAELYLAATTGVERPEQARLLMNTFPAQGMNTTYDLTSVIPDSASTATALSTGHKTASGVINMNPDGTEAYTAITEIAKDNGWKVGILSSVSLDHATPAAFYAHQPSRGNMYEICMELANSGFDYFAGGQMLRHAGPEGSTDAVEAAQANGFTVVSTLEELQAIQPGSGKVIAMDANVDGSAAMQYALDRAGTGPTLTDYVREGIRLLDNETGFIMMVEGGKIDWACHANDAAASIHDTLELDAAIAEAYAFYQQHPDETLIVVTGDHETGGMTIGFAGTQYDSFVEKIQYQRVSYLGFDEQLAAYKETHTLENAKIEDVLPLIEEAFGLKAAGAEDDPLLLSEIEMNVLEEAFIESMSGEEERASDDYTYLLYGGYEPLTIKCTTILNQKSGIAWTSYSHTGVPVQTSAIGVGAEAFNGYYDQTDIHTKMVTITGL